ncbi:MAG: 6,7-dimethyl-8-ribityllumazine synthase [Verrucomicrobiales bacterium]|nr:6,7-dimethyl-8-ribityllumazine synthase [Verrucomicrobiales bacterium]
MSDQAYPTTPQVDSAARNIIIVASQYNPRFTDGLVNSAQNELAKLLPHANIQVHRVPGAFEIPVIVETVCQQAQKPDAVIALGVIIRGSTAHADLIAATITDSLQRSATTHLIPVIHEVLLLDNEKQAEERALGSQINRGIESAQAASSMIQVFDQLA